MLLPAVAYFLLFSYLPMTGVVVAFKNYNFRDGIFGSPWVGLDNFKYFFISGQAWTVTRNTILYNLLFIAVNTILQMGLAILISEIAGKYFKKITQTVMFLPYFISWVVVGMIAYNFLNVEHGTINTLISKLGAEKINFYGTTWVWPIILVFFSAWKNVGYGTVLYLAAIMGIDTEIYEAAQIDGANTFQSFWHITVPHIRTVVGLLVVLRTIWIFNSFDIIYLITGGGPANKTLTVPIYAYNIGWGLKQLGRSSAVTVLLLLFLLIVCAQYFRLLNKWEEEK